MHKVALKLKPFKECTVPDELGLSLPPSPTGQTASWLAAPVQCKCCWPGSLLPSAAGACAHPSRPSAYSPARSAASGAAAACVCTLTSARAAQSPAHAP